MHLPERARPIWAWLGAHQPWSALVPLLVVQWLALLALAVTVKHNGLLYYQGGDQTYYWTQAHLLSDWTLPVTAIGYAWSYLLTPIALFAGANVLSGLPAVLLLNIFVLLPVALLCIYGIAARIGGRYLGYWAAFLWVLIPYAAIPMFDHRYHQKYLEHHAAAVARADRARRLPVDGLPARHRVPARPGARQRDWTTPSLAGLVGAFAIGSSRRTRSSSAPRSSASWSRDALDADRRLRAALVPGPVSCAPLEAARARRAAGVLVDGGDRSGGDLAAIGANCRLARYARRSQATST
jgi:hypothetical protein